MALSRSKPRLSLQNIHPHFRLPWPILVSSGVTFLVTVAAASVLVYQAFSSLKSENSQTKSQLEQSKQQAEATQQDLEKQLAETQQKLTELQNTDQVKRNKELQAQVAQTRDIFQKSLTIYQDLVELETGRTRFPTLDSAYASFLASVSKLDTSGADAILKKLTADIATQQAKSAAADAVVASKVSNTPPDSGYQRQAVQALGSSYTVDIVSADLGSTRVIIDTASDSTCANNCPVLPLGTYVARSGAFAGVNGSYFCPETYPSCADKKNAFDTLLMNKNKVYFNSDNNVYSNVPAAIFSGSARFVGASSEWGRDTGVDGVIANQPLLLSGGEVRFGGGSDPKQGSKGSRSFVGSKGSKVYIGVVRNATVAEVAQVLKAMGLENALNLDSGGSTALWAGGGYKAGPGRNIPNVVLFVRR